MASSAQPRTARRLPSVAVFAAAFLLIGHEGAVAQNNPPPSWTLSQTGGVLVANVGPPETVSYAFFACDTKAPGQFEIGIQGDDRRPVAHARVRVTVDKANFDFPVTKRVPDEGATFLVANVPQHSRLLWKLRSARRIAFSFTGTATSGVLRAGRINDKIIEVIDKCVL